MSSQPQDDKYKIERVSDPADPARCQSTPGGRDQCMMRAVPGSKYCPLHGGNKAGQAAEQQRIRQYNLAKWASRQAHFAESVNVKSLRDEIGILRMMIEERLNGCKDSTDLMINSSAISTMILNVEKLVSSCHKIEVAMDLMIDKTAIVALGLAIVELVAEYVDDPDEREALARGLLTLIEKASSKEDENA